MKFQTLLLSLRYEIVLTFLVAMFGKHETIALLLSKGANPNIGNNRNTTALHKAAQRGELRCLNLLLQSGATINVQDEDGITSLHRAINALAETKNTEKAGKIMRCITELVNRKARLNLSDKDGCIPSDLAAKHGLTEVLELLVQHEADISHR